MSTMQCLLNLLGTMLIGGADPIKSAEFPTVSHRAIFFEKRINAADPEIRKRVLIEVGYFHGIPDAEYVAFLWRMTRDPDAVIRGRAILKLHEMWVPIPHGRLPQTFSGYHDRQLIDLENASTIRSLMAACQGRGFEAGYAAYVLGLLQH